MVPSERNECPHEYYYNNTEQACVPISTAPEDFCSNNCNPCEIQCTAPGRLSPDPLNCSAFYVCMEDGSLLPESCDNGTPYYNHIAESCDTSPEYCYQSCDICAPYCTENGLIPNPKNCSSFYMCSLPYIALYDCPTDTFFDPETLVCSEFYECEPSLCRPGTTTVDYSTDATSTVDYSTDATSTMDYSPDTTSTVDYSTDASSTMDYSTDASSTMDYSTDTSSTVDYTTDTTDSTDFSIDGTDQSLLKPLDRLDWLCCWNRIFSAGFI